MPEEKVLPVRVAIRARPLIPKEVNEGCQQCLTYIPGEPQLVLGNNKAFTYDFVFDPETPQIKVYEGSVKTLVNGFFKGYNATVLAYGQTGSGKTFSMGGAYDAGNEETIKGIIPRVIYDIFEGINRRKEKHDFTVKVSYLEIYKEDLLDLLVPAASRSKDAVAIREGTHGGIRITGLEEKVVTSMREMLDCLERGALGRTTGATAMNSTSSRSHAIFTIHLDRKNKEDSNDYFNAKFHLVDLAGSERQKKTNAEGDRLKEGININLGLLALGNVISALGEENSKRHIPYRESKLTRLLQDSLGGNSNTVMIACVSPADSNYEETLSTLRYADRARKIKNKPVVNRDPQAAEIMRLKALVHQMQQQLLDKGGAVQATNTSSRSSLDSSIDTSLMKEIISKLEEENGKLKAELVNAIHQNTSMYEKVISLEQKNDRLKESMEKLREKTGLSLSIMEANPDLQAKIKEIQEQVTEMETIQESCLVEDTTPSEEEGTLNTSTQEVTSARKSDANYTTEDVLKEAQLKNKMYELNDQLAQKEALLKEITTNNTTFTAFHDKFESELKEREAQIIELQREKEDLSDKLSSAKAAMNTTKVGEQRRRRVKELETKITAIQKQNKEQAKLLKMRETSAKESLRLRSEIGELKKCRVTLMKQMRAESEASRKWKQKKEKEVMQLKAKERKQKAEFSKMERAHTQQQQVMRRKVDEASAANRRLREALEKQKKVAAERLNKQERHNAHNQAKMTKWLNNEFEIVVSVEENRHLLTQMLAERKDLSSRLTSLKDELDLPPTKRKMLDNSRGEDTDEHKHSVSKRIEEVERDLKHLNLQITETQQRIVEADEDEKAKSRWDEVKTLMEARCALSLLLEKAVKAQVERLEEASKAIDTAATLEEKEAQLAALETKVNTLKDLHNKNVTNLHQEAEQRMAPLLHLLNQKVLSQEDVDSVVRLNQEGLDRLVTLQDQLSQQSDQLDRVNSKLLKTTHLGKQGHTSFFGHLDSTPQLDDLAPRRGKMPQSYMPATPAELWSPGMEPPTPGGPNLEEDPDWSPSLWKAPKGKNETKRGHRRTGVPAYNLSDSEAEVSSACKCKGDCSTKRCRCKKSDGFCGDSCSCDNMACVNKAPNEENTQTSAMNSTFLMENSAGDEEQEPKTRSGVKRNSSGKPLVEKKQFPGIFTDSDSSLNSTDDFMDATFSNRRKFKKPYFDAPTPPI